MFVMFDGKLSGKSVQRYTFIAYNEPLGWNFWTFKNQQDKQLFTVMR